MPDGRGQLLAAARAELEENGRAAIGLRAIARRAGLSHAAPGYFFKDHAGMLTALATEGFTELSGELETVDEREAPARLEALGRRYVHFGLSHPALLDLMFSASDLHTDDPDLRAAQHRAISALTRVLDAGDPAPPDPRTVMAWALAHGLATLAGQGALTPNPNDAKPTVDAVLAAFADVMTRSASGT
ncbi:MAG: TetR family transcriptional regulator [Amnibacterium sp.]|nr:TetR family transcriptional regulator [Amnibacterium sp.]